MIHTHLNTVYQSGKPIGIITPDLGFLPDNPKIDDQTCLDAEWHLRHVTRGIIKLFEELLSRHPVIRKMHALQQLRNYGHSLRLCNMVATFLVKTDDNYAQIVINNIIYYVNLKGA